MELGTGMLRPVEESAAPRRQYNEDDALRFAVRLRLDVADYVARPRAAGGKQRGCAGTTRRG